MHCNVCFFNTVCIDKCQVSTCSISPFKIVSAAIVLFKLKKTVNDHVSANCFCGLLRDAAASSLAAALQSNYTSPTLSLFSSLHPLSPLSSHSSFGSRADGGEDVAVVMWQHAATILVMPRSEEGLVMTSSQPGEEE